MSRKLAFAAAVAALVPSTAAAQPTELMPAVTYEQQVQFTAHGPVVVHVLTAPKPGGLYAVQPVLSNGAVVAREALTAMQKAASVDATVAGVNGPARGTLTQAGILHQAPVATRSSVGIADDGTLHVERVSLFAYWRGTGQRRPFGGLNDPPGQAASGGIPGASSVTLYTPAWGPSTPRAPGVVEAVIAPFPPTASAKELSGPVVAVTENGDTAIPRDGAVLAASGDQVEALRSEAPVGTTVAIRLTLDPDWSTLANAIGAGPALVRRGVPIFRANEMFEPPQLASLNARTAVGQLADGRIVLVAVDGRQPGYSTGMTNFELAQTLDRLGAVTAAALELGLSTSMAFDGTLLNRPPRAQEPEVASALLVLYAGVHVPALAEPVLSPNGDGVGEQQTLAYKLVRPSTVNTALVAPDGTERSLESGPKPTGSHAIVWTGATPQGTGTEPEGTWRFRVTALDEQGRSSTAERSFQLNNTLGYLEVPAVLSLDGLRARLVASYQLARSARITVTVETEGGAVVQTLLRARSTPLGPATVRWDGRTVAGRAAVPGAYVLRVVAENALGRVELQRRFTVRRGAG